jgi:hypothetical protein
MIVLGMLIALIAVLRMNVCLVAKRLLTLLGEQGLYGGRRVSLLCSKTSTHRVQAKTYIGLGDNVPVTFGLDSSISIQIGFVVAVKQLLWPMSLAVSTGAVGCRTGTAAQRELPFALGRDRLGN